MSKTAHWTIILLLALLIALALAIAVWHTVVAPHASSISILEILTI
jgi:hypothetical protein